jgi:hypothetical protein
VGNLRVTTRRNVSIIGRRLTAIWRLLETGSGPTLAQYSVAPVMLGEGVLIHVLRADGRADTITRDFEGRSLITVGAVLSAAYENTLS